MRIKDVLNFGGLKDAKLIAGIDGINNKVTSISVLEVAEEKIKNWVLENQLYITSFYAIIQNVKMQMEVILALYEKGSAGLVICHIDMFIKEIHPKVIELCNRLGFPLIIANSKRSYIEILNPVILKLMGNLGPEYDTAINMQNKLIEHIATKKDVNYIYKTMSEEYGKGILFLDINNSVVYPRYNKNIKEIDGIIDFIKSNAFIMRKNYEQKGYYVTNNFTKNYMIVPIQCNGLEFGTIITEIVGDSTEESAKKLRNIASLCTLIFTKNSRIIEMEAIRKQEYISDLITWNFRTDEIAIKMGQDIGWDILNKNRMIIINLNDVQKSIEVDNRDFKNFIDKVLYNKIENVVRADNDRNLIGLRSDIFLILLETSSQESCERANNLSYNILKCCKNTLKGSVSIGISRNIDNYRKIPNAYIEAMDAAKLGRYFLGDNRVVNFYDLGFYGIFREISSITRFNEIEKNLFKKLKQYDKEENSNLYDTLKVLIYNDMNTEKTAEQLFLHRNTVNYRKKKITEILGYEPWNMPYLMNTVIAMVSEYFK